MSLALPAWGRESQSEPILFSSELIVSSDEVGEELDRAEFFHDVLTDVKPRVEKLFRSLVTARLEAHNNPCSR